jgi:hypothetical protein
LSNYIGQISVSGGVLVLGGNTLSNATLAAGLNLTRVGTAIAAIMSSMTITSGSTTVAVNAVFTGFSAAGWTPLNGPGPCNGGMPQQRAFVDGLVFQPA